MIQTHFRTVKNKIFSDGIKIGTSAEADICLSCNLPEVKCKGSERCKRYKEEKAKLLDKGGKK